MESFNITKICGIDHLRIYRPVGSAFEEFRQNLISEMGRNSKYCLRRSIGTQGIILDVKNVILGSSRWERGGRLLQTAA